ncbi:hypothetical protein EC973_006430 [Apophysomyces ossiformis]|uniref:Tetrapyrrole biosynthesis uroporphyrinogen III synthase domain-containing protein n=1 Tax=Apophysomyces ossiformis TaxID=679940 RepID=A0A8H7EUK4_9FUNG|nr:hypothetical protein EC973_006430 [Apophysomyces ossiformis]
MTRRVWVFKAKNEPHDEYENELLKHGYHPEFIPVLDHHCASVPELRTILESGPSGGQGIIGVIVTSQRAVETLAKASEHMVGKERWNSVTAYVVGPTTADSLKQLHLFGNMVVADKATALCDQMTSHLLSHQQDHDHDRHGSLLFLAGDKRRDTIPHWLTEAKIPFQEIRTYATCAHPLLKEQMEKICSEISSQDWTVYFSPSGVNYLRQTDTLLADKLFRTQRAAIGPTTADHLVSLGWPVDAMASRPNEVHLVSAMVEKDTTK